MQFYGIPFMHAKAEQAKQIYQYKNIKVDVRKKYHKTACTSLAEDEHLDVRNMLKTL
jgi:hypothetical protein